MNLLRLTEMLEGITPDGVDCHTMRPELGNGNAIEAETGVFLYSLVQRFNPTTVVETGTHWGFSSACIASALADLETDYPRGRHLHTYDVNEYDGKPEKLWSDLGIGNYVTRYIGDARTGEKPLPVGTVIDFLYLDADHSAESVVAEWQQFAPLLNRYRALVAFHDTRLDVREAEGIRRILLGKMHPYGDYRFVSWMPFRNFRGFDMLLLSNEEGII